VDGASAEAVGALLAGPGAVAGASGGREPLLTDRALAIAASRHEAVVGERSPDRVNSRNGYRTREWDTRAGTIELEIPKLRQGSYFPDWLLQPRRAAGEQFGRVEARDCLMPCDRTSVGSVHVLAESVSLEVPPTTSIGHSGASDCAGMAGEQTYTRRTAMAAGRLRRQGWRLRWRRDRRSPRRPTGQTAGR
jgi:hypothetical protein